MSQKLYDSEKIDRAVAVFEGEGLSAPEALLASTRLLVQSLERMKKEAPAIRESASEEVIKDFAMIELNEVIYDIQDTVPVALRIFNSYMRDPDPK